MIFLLKLSICWGFFALFYALMLRQETFFHLNRLYLLSTAVLGILLAGASDWLFSFTGSMGTQLIALPVVDIGLQQLGRTAQQWGGLNLLWAVYWFGVVFTGLRTLWGITRLVGMAIRGRSERLPDGCLLIETSESATPFSFFKWVFVPAPQRAFLVGDLQNREANQVAGAELMLAHERAHVHGRHSADVLFAELLCIVWWFHPLAHWYRRALRVVHEFLADQAASRRTDKKQYGLLLIRQSQPGLSVALVNHFFQSPLKQRLIMLMRHNSAPFRALKYTLLLPLLAFLILVFQQAPALAQTPREKPSEISDLDTPPKFPGGEQAMMQFLGGHIQYPEAARKAKAEGMPVLSFVIEKDGSVSNVENLTPKVRPDLVEEAIRVVKAMPHWEPGVKGQQAVRVKFTLPIRFKLS